MKLSQVSRQQHRSGVAGNVVECINVCVAQCAPLEWLLREWQGGYFFLGEQFRHLFTSGESLLARVHTSVWHRRLHLLAVACPMLARVLACVIGLASGRFDMLQCE